MNVGELMDELGRYDRNTPVRITGMFATERFQCDECGAWQSPGNEDYWAIPVNLARYPVGSGHKLTVVIEVQEE